MGGHGTNDTLRFSAQSDADAQVHAVDVPRDALVDPSRLKTTCGRSVFEVYNDHRAVTCPARADGDRVGHQHDVRHPPHGYVGTRDDKTPTDVVRGEAAR
jgi:hypothetical protein